MRYRGNNGRMNERTNAADGRVGKHTVWTTVKVKASHTRYRALGPELIPVYRPQVTVSHPPARPAVTLLLQRDRATPYVR